MSGDPKKMTTTEQEDPPPDGEGRDYDDYERAADRVISTINTLRRVVAEGHLERTPRRESA